MAVPKKRTGASAQGHRRSNWKATVPETTTCPNCGELVLTHTVCTACGQYKGKVVSRKAEGFVEVGEVKEAKKAPKKSTKKAEKVEETKVEEVVESVEEVKAEEITETAEVVESPAEEKAEETTEE